MEPHGGNLRRASERYGTPMGGWLDFSANINPLGVPPVLKEVLHRVVEEELEHYPDPDCKQLVTVLAQYHGLDRENVLCGNGASELLQLALEVWPEGRLLLPVPSFVEYEQAARLGGHEPVFFPLTKNESFVPDMERLCARLTECDGLVLGNPNNPTSVLLSESDLMRLLGTGKRLLVDEAFVELTLCGEANSLARHLTDFPNLLIVRAFTKSLAIPGLRLGYALGHKNTVQAMKKRQIPWSVNRGAQAMGEVFPLLAEHREKTKAWLSTELDYLWQGLNRLPGITAFQPATNFILCQYEQEVDPLADALAKRGILIRPGENFRGLDSSWFRVAVRSRQENQRLLSVLQEVLLHV